ncbi:hypothetical protein [uncultured Dubosiella sp.]|uniref:hypothetical protein n=1 Tax=uncultured Dubosiella sp. TaxID=1937011 RepID=UPI000EBE51E0|nr:hypothetical protein [uncultured Dubosiella sp.]GJM58216.1 hypothetical protein EROP_19090 [Erysipelotrichaceae bacterium OPF54]HAM31044.1 hypothetical protein [Erysipelotrichaceae bacterium]
MSVQTLVGAVLLFGGLVGVYITLYLMNKRTPLPAGCENLKADCDGCKDYSCMNNPSHDKINEGGR